MTQQYSYAAAYEQPKKRKVPGWVWGLIIAAVLIALIVILSIAVSRRSGENQGVLPVGEDYVAVLHVEGTMVSDSSSTGIYGGGTYDQDWLLSTLEELTEDENNRALLLYIDSPGGEVMAASDLGQAVVDYKEATGRPVYAYGHNYAASGGYWLAAAADRFFVNRYCITGSIGVTYGNMFDFSGLLEKYGVKVNTITSGEQKSMGSSWEEMSPETRAIFQAIIDEYYGYFLDWVCEQRGMDRESLKALADGRVYTASQAVANGLADEVGSYDDCLAALLDQVGDIEAVELEPTVTTDWTSLLWQNAADKEISSLLALLPPSGPLAYYAE